MKKETRNAIIATLISIIIIVAIIAGAYNIIIGKNGIITKVSSVESEFDKGEVLEELTEAVKEKYMAAYNESKESTDKKLEDCYNVEVAITYLVEKNILEYYYFSNYDETSKIYTYISDDQKTEAAPRRDDCFWVNSNNMNNVKTFGKGAKFLEDGNLNKIDVFLVEKTVENDVTSYVLNYYDYNGEKEFVGNLEIANPLIK